MNVYQKLQAARVELQSIEMRKSGHNKFAGYYYFELGDFLSPIQIIFNKLGLCGIVSFTSEIASLTVIDADKPESTICFTSPFGSASLKGAHEIQNIGAVETYQRRYLWVTAMEIVEHDAIDSADKAEPEPKKQAKPESVSDKVLADLMAVLDSASDMDELKSVFASAWKESKGHASVKKHYESLKGNFVKDAA